MEITDKELLAICNLSNLKMEFANLIKSVKTIDRKEIYTNHTIYSLLNEEITRMKTRTELELTNKGRKCKFFQIFNNSDKKIKEKIY